MNVVEFYYPEEIALFEREFVEAEQAAYMETAVEDDEIAIRMDEGRKLLYAQGRSEVGPYQSPMEDGMQHFHEFYRREMGADAGGARIWDLGSGRAETRRRFDRQYVRRAESGGLRPLLRSVACRPTPVVLGRSRRSPMPRSEILNPVSRCNPSGCSSRASASR